MTEEPKKFSNLDADEQQGFYDLADEFIRVANDACDAEPAPVVAAAFLYACARYNAFAMQTAGNTPCEVDEEAAAYLTEDFDAKLREHMSEQVTEFPGEPGAQPEQPPVIAALEALDGMDEDEQSDFLDLADHFINAANALVRTQRATRISAAFSYGCARFNAFVLQVSGFPSADIDEAAAVAMRDLYEKTLRMHMAETLIKPNG